MVKNLRFLREEMGLSQQKLAEMLNVTQQTIFKYEKTSVEPDIEMLIKLAEVFEVSVDYLIGYSDMRDKNNSCEMLALSENEVNHIKLWRSLPKNVRCLTEKLLTEMKK